MDRITAARFVTPTIFALLALMFAALSLFSPQGTRTAATSARRLRARLALIFALVSFFLFWLQLR